MYSSMLYGYKLAKNRVIVAKVTTSGTVHYFFFSQLHKNKICRLGFAEKEVITEY